MSTLRAAYENGRRDALARMKLATPAPTHPTVKQSPVLSNAPAKTLSADAQQRLRAPTDPAAVKDVFNTQEQGRTRLEPLKKTAENICTTCRKPKHYGSCAKPARTRPDGVPLKQAQFNIGLTGSDPSLIGNDGDSATSPAYSSATTADSSLARARDGRPADEQAATAFADLFRHLGITPVADQALNNTNGLDKTALAPSMMGHSSAEDRGPTPNVYEEMFPPQRAPIVGLGESTEDAITRAFSQVDNAADSTSLEGSTGSSPSGGPAALG